MSLSSTVLGVGFVFVGATLLDVGSVTIQLFEEGYPSEALQGWQMLVGVGLLFFGGLLRGEPILFSYGEYGTGNGDNVFFASPSRSRAAPHCARPTAVLASPPFDFPSDSGSSASFRLTKYSL